MLKRMSANPAEAALILSQCHPETRNALIEALPAAMRQAVVATWVGEAEGNTLQPCLTLFKLQFIGIYR